MVLNRNALSRHEKTWKNLQCILLSERRESEKATDYVIPTIQILKRQSYGNKKISGFKGLSWGNKQSTGDYEAVKLFCVLL